MNNPEPRPVTNGKRLDIQALRALAVVLVIADHLLPGRITGGYIGVDVFFVISGYLITSHLYREITSTRRIDLPRFWARRAKRLLPAAMLVLVVTLALTALFLPSTRQQSAYEQIAAAGTYILNWVLANNAVDYFAHDAASSPVTHYWSLSVEEQFYVAWPLLLLVGVLVARILRKRPQIILISIIAIVLAASFSWAAYNTDSPATYFETTSRAWEFAAGGLLAFVPRSTWKAAPAVAALWASWLILPIAALVFTSSSGVPGWAALVPVIATCAIIWIGDVDHPASPARLTSLAPIQFTGEISYSLYLWHWPLIIFSGILLNGTPTLIRLSVILVATFALAWLSTKYVETPIRQAQHSRIRKPRWVLAGTAVTMTALLALALPLSAQAASRTVAIVESLHQQSLNPAECFGAQAELSGAECRESHTLADRDYVSLTRLNQNDDVLNGSSCIQGRFPSTADSGCSFGVKDGEQLLDVALVGDSHADVWTAALNALAEDLPIRVHTQLASGCPITQSTTVEYIQEGNQLGSNLEECSAWRTAVIEEITDDPTIDIVFTTSRDQSYGTITDGSVVMDDGSGYEAAWSAWLDAGKKVIVVDDVPEMGFSVPECIQASGTSVDPCTIPAATDKPGPLARAASHMDDPDFTFLDFRDVFCDAQRCHSVVGGIPITYDNSHMNAPFARSFAPTLLELDAFQR